MIKSNIQKKDRSSEQSGSLMIEAIALLGLMSIMSPMVVRQTSDRTTEMEDAVLAGQMKTLKDALKNYLEVHYEQITASPSTQTLTGAIPNGNLVPFLPASMIVDGNKIRGNKFVEDDGFKFGYTGICTKTLVNNGVNITYQNGNACASAGGWSSTCKCMSWNLTGVVVTNSGSEIPDKRISRVAQMVGADGGFVPTGNYQSGFGVNGNSVVGSQGMWQIDDLSSFSVSDVGTGGQLAAITGYAGGTQGDYLYRRKVNGIPDANSMFTDLDMGGNGQCDEHSADGQCSRIHSAGGVEVVDGRLIVRTKHEAVGNWNEETDVNNSHIISLGLGNAVMAVNTKVDLTAAGRTAMTLDENHASLEMLSEEKDHGVFVDVNGAVMTLEHSASVTVDGSGAKIEAFDDNSVIQLGINGIEANSKGIFNVTTNNGIYMNTQKEVGIHSIGNTSISANNDILLSAGGDGSSYSRLNMHSSGSAFFTTTDEITIQTGNSSSTGQIRMTNNARMAPNGAVASNLFYNGAHTEVIGGLIINTEGNRALLFSKDGNGNGTPVVISDTGISMQRGLAAGQADYDSERSKADVTLTAVNNIGGRFMLANGTPNIPQIEMRGDSGLIFASQFIPRVAVTLGNGMMDNHMTDNRGFGNRSAIDGTVYAIVNSESRFSFDANTGEYSATGSDISYKNADTFNMNITMASTSYNAHKGGGGGQDASGMRFKVDPGFESVMNDIRLTSRGGARLSEILPNYIIKGIYELSNTYKVGPWPCVKPDYSDPDHHYESDGSAHCSFRLKNPADLPNIDQPYSCNDFSSEDTSATGQGGAVAGYSNKPCNMDGSTMEINLYRDEYAECTSSDCIAHPYLGVVPAPGRGITPSSDGYINGMGTMTGYDEGPCPDGYTPNMIFTPARFEVGKVLHAISRYDYSEPMYGADGSEIGEEAWIAKNYDKNRWDRSDQGVDGDYASSTEGLFQPSTQMEYATKAVKKADGTVLGWQVAMGTYSQVGEDFVWNYGGTTRVGDMFGYATTYCTFNPQRYMMPNMKSIYSDDGSGNKVIAPMRGIGDLRDF